MMSLAWARFTLPIAYALLIAVFTTTPSGAETIELDLAKEKSGSVITRTVDPGQVLVHVSHLAPWLIYDQRVIRRTRAIPALIGRWPFQTQSLEGRPPCEEEQVALLNELKAAQTEAAVRDLVVTAEKRLKDKGCSDDQRTETLLKIEDGTTEPISLAIRDGEEVTVTISRKGKDEEGKDTVLAWTVVLDTKPEGTWITSYGASMIPDRDETFFLQPTANAGEFVVIREEDRKGEMVVQPSMFFTWFPESNSFKRYSWGPTAGFAVGDHLAVFAGWSVLWKSNVQLSAGLSAIRIKRLAGEQSEGQIVTTNLSGDQLHRTTIWPAWFLALTFRFGSDPFADEQASKGTAKGEEKEEGATP